jgi:hypothetical protein
VERDLHAVADEIVLLAVRRYHRLHRRCHDDLPHGVVIGLARQPRVQLDQFAPEIARQDDLAVRCTAEQAIRPEVLVVVGVHRVPPEVLLQVLSGGLLNEGVLGVGVH